MRHTGYAENTGSYFESVEIQVFMNLLRIVDNTRQDIPLISAMRSAVFDFSVRELAQVRAEFSDGSFYDGVRAYAESGEDRELADRIKDMMERIAHWKMLKNTVPLEELVRTLLMIQDTLITAAAFPWKEKDSKPETPGGKGGTVRKKQSQRALRIPGVR